jgi:hypothetical protein
MARKNTSAPSEASSYEDLMTAGYDNIPDARLLPDGHWRVKVVGLNFRPGNENVPANINVTYEPVAPGDDVNAEALAELGDYDTSQNRVYKRLFCSNVGELRRVVQHFKKHAGFEPAAGTPVLDKDGDGDKVNDAFKKAARGAEVTAMMATRSYVNKDGDTVTENDLVSFSEIG